MSKKENGPGGQPGPGNNGKQISTIDSPIIAELPKNSQIQIKIELNESIDIASAWLRDLFVSDDPDDEARLCDVWDEFLRQRQLWVEVRQ